MPTMKFEQFIQSDVDCDVFNTITGGGNFAFVGPIALTDAGKEEFKLILNLEVDVDEESACATVTIPTEEDDHSIDTIRTLNRFLKSAAGYCPQSTWDRWFYFPDEDGTVTEFDVGDDLQQHVLGSNPPIPAT